MTVETSFDIIVARSRVIDRKHWQGISGLSDAVIRRLDQSGEGPPLVRLSARRVGYRLGDCLDWLEARKDRRRGPAARSPSSGASAPGARTLEPAAATKSGHPAIKQDDVGGEALGPVQDERRQRGGRVASYAASKSRGPSRAARIGGVGR